MRYRVTLGDHSYDVDLGTTSPRIDGGPVEAELVNVSSTGLRSLLLGGRSYTLAAERGETRGSWRITLDGRTFEAEVLDERAFALRKIAGAEAAPTARIIKAPMPGLVVRVNVTVGQAVVAGQGIVVVEAMKMENEIKAPVAGIVSRIDVLPGQAVDKGIVMVVLE
jgi:pyruvate carboxylase subunit B